MELAKEGEHYEGTSQRSPEVPHLKTTAQPQRRHISLLPPSPFLPLSLSPLGTSPLGTAGMGHILQKPKAYGGFCFVLFFYFFIRRKKKVYLTFMSV